MERYKKFLRYRCNNLLNKILIAEKYNISVINSNIEENVSKDVKIFCSNRCINLFIKEYYNQHIITFDILNDVKIEYGLEYIGELSIYLIKPEEYDVLCKMLKQIRFG